MAQNPQIGALPAAETKVKVACQSCGARFVVRDPRVRGHRFRATCKRCGSLIVGSAAEEPKPANGEGRRAPTASVAASEGPDAEQWYIIKRGKPKGPYSRDELQQALQSGELKRKTYVWRNGDGDWRRIADVPELNAPPPDDESEASTRFFQAPADSDPEDEPTRMAGAAEDPDGEPTRMAGAAELDPEDEPTRMAGGGEAPGPQDWSMEVEVTRLVRGRQDELSSKLMRMPDAAAWQAQPRQPHPAFGAAPGKMSGGFAALPKRPGLDGAPAAAGVWAAVPRRPAILPAPSRRNTLGSPGMAQAQPAQPAVPPPEAEPVAALLAAAAAASTHAPAAVPAASMAPRPFQSPVAPTVADPPNALSWVPNPVPIGPVGAKPAAGPLLLPKPPRFWTPPKIALIVGLPVGLAIIALAITLLVTRSSAPPTAPPAAAPPPQAPPQVAIAVKPPPEPARRSAPPPPAAREKPAPREAAPASEPPQAAPEPATAAKPKPKPKPAAPTRSRPREVTVAVRTQVKRIAPRSAPRRAARAEPDADDLLAAAASGRRSKPKKRAAAVDVDAMLEAGASGTRRPRGRKPAAPAGEPGGPALSRDVDADALLSAGGATPRATPSKLSKGQIRSTMSKLRGHVQRCFASQAGAAGIVQIATTVQPDGSASGRAVGSYAGTAAGNCAARGVAGLRFPRFSGAAMRFTFPFAL